MTLEGRMRELWRAAEVKRATESGWGILAYGTYLPHWRLRRSAIGDALGAPAGSGTRSVASFDEDSLTMAVEAGRRALRGAVEMPANLVFSTASPPYLDKTNATAAHAALSLPSSTAAYDLNGSARSAVAAVQFGTAEGSTLALSSDVRTGLPGSVEESRTGDAAAALLLGNGDDLIAELIGTASATAEFLDRWRLPGELSSRCWEERFAEQIYIPMALDVLDRVCAAAGLGRQHLQRVIVTSLHERAAKAVRRSVGLSPEQTGSDFIDEIGNCGAAHMGLLVADALDRACPGDVIAVVVLADGCDALLFRVTDLIEHRRQDVPLTDQLDGGSDDVDYLRFLTWRSVLSREPPRRPDPAAPAAPPAARRADWKFSFTGNRCRACGMVHLPPTVRCLDCGEGDLSDHPMAGAEGKVATFTVDHLAFSPSPPSIVAVVDFDDGGRIQCELTDVDPAELEIGTEVEMTFRCLGSSGGIHNYFWKARPKRKAG